MKKISTPICAVLLIAAMTGGCKKSDTPALKDYAKSIKNKTWWGGITYTSKPKEYYSVHFRPDGTLLWSQLSDNYEGHWVLKDRRLVMKFDATTAEISADISDNNELMNITDNTGFYEVNNGQILSNPNISVDNTVWKGIVHQSSGPSYTVQLNFLPGTKVVLSLGPGSYPATTYIRPEAGAVIEMVVGAAKYFYILTSGTEMMGNSTGDYTVFPLTKQ